MENQHKLDNISLSDESTAGFRNVYYMQYASNNENIPINNNKLMY